MPASFFNSLLGKEGSDMGSGKGLVLVTGAAGFIGSHVSRRLLERTDNLDAVGNTTAATGKRGWPA